MTAHILIIIKEDPAGQVHTEARFLQFAQQVQPQTEREQSVAQNYLNRIRYQIIDDRLENAMQDLVDQLLPR